MNHAKYVYTALFHLFQAADKKDLKNKITKQKYHKSIVHIMPKILLKMTEGKEIKC